MTTNVLTPFGSVRARFYDLKNEAEFSPSISKGLDEKLRNLAEKMTEFQLEPMIVWNAFDLVCLQDGLSESEQYWLVVLLVVLRTQQAYGSTCIEPGAANRVLAKVLRDDLKLEDYERVERGILELLEFSGPSRLPMLLGVAGDYKSLIIKESAGQKFLYIEQVYGAERSLIQLLDGFCKRSQAGVSDEVIEAYIQEIEGSSARGLGEKQRGALQTCLNNPLVLISGGPGTGKTTLVFSVLRMLVKNGVLPEQIALAAPTGKAANRMGESLKNSFDELAVAQAKKMEEVPSDASELKAIFESAQTIHRLLGYSPARGVFMRNEKTPLDAKVVIVDEASMLDLNMMLALVRALSKGSRLILLGDANQLPSVDAGAVFRDLIPAAGTVREGVSATELTKNHRVQSGKSIVKFAKSINAGAPVEVGFVLKPTKVSEFETLPYERTARVDFTVGDELSGKDAALIQKTYGQIYDGFLGSWFERHYKLADGELPDNMVLADGQPVASADIERLAAVFARYNRARVLCLTRKRATGADAINRKMHAFFRKKFSELGAGAFLVGEPVMMLTNDYGLQIFNGDQGVIIGVKRELKEGEELASWEKRSTTRYVAFPTADPGKFRIVELGKIAGNIELSYAMTVHKSQGSEYRHVALMLPTEVIPLLTREILYTGVTRASVSVTLVGSKEMLEAGARNPTCRVTGLGRW